MRTYLWRSLYTSYCPACHVRLSVELLSSFSVFRTSNDSHLCCYETDLFLWFDSLCIAPIWHFSVHWTLTFIVHRGSYCTYIYEIAYDYLRIYLRYLLAAISDIPRVSHCALAYLFFFSFSFFFLFLFLLPLITSNISKDVISIHNYYIMSLYMGVYNPCSYVCVCVFVVRCYYYYFLFLFF